MTSDKLAQLDQDLRKCELINIISEVVHREDGSEPSAEYCARVTNAVLRALSEFLAQPEQIDALARLACLGYFRVTNPSSAPAELEEHWIHSLAKEHWHSSIRFVIDGMLGNPVHK